MVSRHLSCPREADTRRTDCPGLFLCSGKADAYFARGPTAFPQLLHPKITACLGALADVPRVHIVNGSTPHVLLYELEAHPHIGTTITR